MDLAKRFGTSKKLEVEGVEVDLGEGFKVRVARANNSRYRTLLQAKLKQHRVMRRNRNLPEDVVERITREAMSEAILLGWTGALDAGEPIEYSQTNALAMLTKYPDFADAIAGLAGDMELFQEQDEEAAQGN